MCKNKGIPFDRTSDEAALVRLELKVKRNFISFVNRVRLIFIINSYFYERREFNKKVNLKTILTFKKQIPPNSSQSIFIIQM